MKKLIFLGLALASALTATATLQADSRIVGGTDAKPGSWPSQVFLKNKNENHYDGLFCGGSLIKPDWIITAAHCVDDENTDSFDVVTDVYNLKTDAGQQLAVKRIITHPDYDFISQDFDIALVQLQQPVTPAVTLPLISGNPNLTGATATVIGWGNMSDDPQYNFYPFKLQEVQVPIISNRECREVAEQQGDSPKTITGNMLCAGYLSGGKDSCQGDSGGPLMVQRSGAWVLAGIVSWGKGCALPLTYGVYSRVSNFLDFIAEQTSVDYFALADVNDDGRIDAADKQAKRDELQTAMTAFVELCWTPAAACGDVNNDQQIDWRDLMKESSHMDNKFKRWQEIAWTPEKTGGRAASN